MVELKKISEVEWQIPKSGAMKVPAAVFASEKPVEMAVSGRDLVNGLPKEIIITDAEVRDAILRSVKNIVTNIKLAIEATPPELVADIQKRG